MDKQQDKVSFTAGPWEARKSYKEYCEVSDHEITGDGWVIAAVINDVASIPSNANAHLIAASPCMYEALVDAEKAFRKTLGMIDAWPDEYATIKAALSKAHPNSNLTPSELRDKLDAVEVIGVVS